MSGRSDEPAGPEDSRELKTMRYMEWERTKGSIRAILASYWDTGSNRFDELNEIADSFMREFGEAGGID